jgi:hypothetical protein
MPSTNVYRTVFQVVKKNTPPFAGSAAQYRREQRIALVGCANDQLILGVLTSDIALASGETIEILHSSQVSQGTEAAVLT